MKIIIGLGNPGKEYEGTRHNVGFVTLDRMVEKIDNGKLIMDKKFNAQVLKADDVLLVKPQTFMNKSGEAVKRLTTYYRLPIADLYVVHDDLDIRLGEYKIQFGKGPKVHNGVNSVEQALGSDQFWHVRVGVDNRITEERQQFSGQDYVLGKFKKKETGIVSWVVSEVIAELRKTLVLDL